MNFSFVTPWGKILFRRDLKLNGFCTAAGVLFPDPLEQGEISVLLLFSPAAGAEDLYGLVKYLAVPFERVPKKTENPAPVADGDLLPIAYLRIG